MRVLIVGAGPAGLLLANYLIRRPGYHVHIIDRQPNPHTLLPESLWSYPIVLQSRGLEALRFVDAELETAMKQQGMHASSACFHKKGGKVQKIPRDPPMLSVNRNQMAITLLDHLLETSHKNEAQHSSLVIDFDCSLDHVDFDKQMAVVVRTPHSSSDTSTKTPPESKQSSLFYDQLVAADGPTSIIRQELVRLCKLQAQFKETPEQYRIIVLSRNAANCGDSILSQPPAPLEADCLHGWMLGDAGRVLAAPMKNDDKVVSGAYIFETGHDPFATLTTPREVQDYFQQVSPSSLAPFLTDNEAAKLLKKNTLSLVSVRCNQLHADKNVLLLGDAAHAAVGHGCNAALQDVQVFGMLLEDQVQQQQSKILERKGWESALVAYTQTRLEDVHAMADLSDYTMPRTKAMKMEWIVRMIVKKLVPFGWGKTIMRPMPMELLSETSLSYSQVLEQTKWWIDRVKTSQRQTTRTATETKREGDL